MITPEQIDAALEALKVNFRETLPGRGYTRATEAWRARRQILFQLESLAEHAGDAACYINWLQTAPDASAEGPNRADGELRDVIRLFAALFPTLLVIPPAAEEDACDDDEPAEAAEDDED